MANKKKNKKEKETVKEVKPEYSILLSSEKGKLTISTELEKQINFLHAHCGAKEWSGVLLYKIDKGDLDDISSLEITALCMYPMDIGTPGYTEYNFNEDNILDMHDYYPQIMKDKWREGHIHTHHNMKAYFSGTDEEELTDNTPNHAYYLSLIVNFAKNYVARLCVVGERKLEGNSHVSFKNVSGDDTYSRTEISSKKEVVYCIDMEIEKEEDSFYGEIEKLEARKEKEKRKISPVYGNQTTIFPKMPEETIELRDVQTLNNQEYSSEDEYGDLIKDFLYKLICLDTQASGHLQSLIIRSDHKWMDATEVEQELYTKNIHDNLLQVYNTVFPNDHYQTGLLTALAQCLEELAENALCHQFADDLSIMIGMEADKIAEAEGHF